MLLTEKMLDDLSAKAKESPRLRINFNLHEDTRDSVQRLFNAMEPGTKVPIHRHQNAAETIIVLRGKLTVRYFDSSKKETESFLLEAGSENFGMHVPKGVWHGVDVIASKTVILEIKEGPYEPLTETDILS